VKEAHLESAIAKSFKVNSNVAGVLYDYFETPEKTFLNLDVEKFDQKEFLGSNHHPLEGLDKEDKTLLQTLCIKGASKSKKEKTKLSELGVIHYQGSNYWQSLERILNYELNADVNCKNTIAPEVVLKSIENQKQKEEEEQRLKEEA
jgi:hypothetical protein